MDEPAKKRQRIISEGEGPLKEGLESLASALEGLYHRVDLIQWKTELPLHLDLSDVQSLQAHLMKFGKKLDKIDGPAPKHKCPQCPKKQFGRLDRLFAHCEANHPEREYLTLSCPCPRSFKYLRQRNEHLKLDHLEEYEMERFLIEEDPAVLSFGRIRYDNSLKRGAGLEPHTSSRDNITRPVPSNAKADTVGEKSDGAGGIWDFKQST